MYEVSVNIGGLDRKLRVTGKALYDLEVSLSAEWKRPVGPRDITSNLDSMVVQVSALWAFMRNTVRNLKRSEIEGWLCGMEQEQKSDVITALIDAICMGYFGKTSAELAEEPRESVESSEVDDKSPLPDGVISKQTP
jgi:hypothetical protein